MQNLTVTCITYYRSDQKNDVIEEKIRAERRTEKIKEVEEEYEKEEKEKMALEMYEKWLVCYSKFLHWLMNRQPALMFTCYFSITCISSLCTTSLRKYISMTLLFMLKKLLLN